MQHPHICSSQHRSPVRSQSASLDPARLDRAPAGPQALRAAGIDIESVPRGGEVTFHGPGQLVAYPVVNIRQLGVGARAWVEGLERSVVRTAALHDVHARVRRPTACMPAYLPHAFAPQLCPSQAGCGQPWHGTAANAVHCLSHLGGRGRCQEELACGWASASWLHWA